MSKKEPELITLLKEKVLPQIKPKLARESLLMLLELVTIRNIYLRKLALYDDYCNFEDEWKKSHGGTIVIKSEKGYILRNKKKPKETGGNRLERGSIRAG